METDKEKEDRFKFAREMDSTESGKAEENNSTEEVRIDEARFNQYAASLMDAQNLPMGILAGLAAAAVGAALWGGITYFTKFQIGWMAVGVGFLVGYAVRFGGKGYTNVYGIIGAGLALLGCLGGNVLAAIGAIARHQKIEFLQALSHFNWEVLPDLLKATFHPMDLLFYGIALYEGYRFSINAISEEEVSKFIIR